MADPTKFLMQRQYKGIDALSLRQDIPVNMMGMADNLQVIGLPGVGGRLISRPGYQKILTTAEAAAIYALSQYVTATSATPPVYSTQLIYTTGGSVKIVPKTVGSSPTALNLTAFTYSDLVIGTPATHVSSVQRPFLAGDVGNTLTITNTTVATYSDLVIGTPATTISSATRPFLATDVGDFVVITGGTGFTVATYTILSVVAGAATLSANAGTIASTGGIATLTTGWTAGAYTISSVSSGVATLSGSAGTIGATKGAASLPNCPFNLNSPNTFMDRTGKYEYIVDGQSGLFRVYVPGTNPTSAYTATQMTTEQVANTPKGITLISVVADAMNSANWAAAPNLDLGWELALISGGNKDGYSMITNNLFNGITSTASNPPPYGWQSWGDTLDNGALANTVFFDTGNGPEGIDWEIPNAAYSGHAQFNHARVWYSTCLSSGTGTLQQLIIAESTTAWTYTDLVIGTPNTTVTSAGRPFQYLDIGTTLNVTSGTGFTVQSVTITSVSGNVATCSAALGTIGSTAGNATLSHGTQTYSDLAIDSSNTSTIKSAAHPFQTTDAGKVITIAGGTNWNKGSYTIISVNGGTHVATLGNGSPAAASNVAATGGQGVLGTVADPSSWGNNNFAPAIIGRGVAGGSVQYNDQASNGTQLTHVYSLTGMATDPDFVVFRLMGPAQNAPTRCNGAIMWPIDSGLKIDTGAASTSLHLQAKVDAQANVGFNCLGGSYVRRTFTTFLDLSTTNTLSMPYAAPTTSPATGIPFRFGFQQSGSSSISWTLPVIYNSTLSEISADISVISSSVRKSIQYFYVQVTSDLPTTVNPNDLCTLGSITSGGSLTINGANINYVQTEIYNTAYAAGTSGNGAATGNTTDGIVETDPSTSTSPDITPTLITAMGQMTMGSVINTGITNMLGLYRYGGVFPSIDPVGTPYYRLIAQLPLWSGNNNVAPGWVWDSAANTWTSTSGQVVWNPTTLVVTDNTPDSAIFLATVLSVGRNALAGISPAGVCGWQNRLVVWSGTQLNLSWLVTVNNAAALYFNDINFPNDPYGTIKGIQTSVGGLDNDPIMACVPMGSSLIILKPRSVWQLAGTDSTNFTLSGHLTRSGVGLMAPRAWCIMQNPMLPIQNVLWFLGPDGVWEYDGGDIARPISPELEPLISPAIGTGGAPISPSINATAAMALHDRCANLIISTPGYTYSDLLITGTSTIVSMNRPFITVDTGKTLSITGGTGFTPGNYTINSVDGNGQATLSSSPGTAWSIQGRGTITGDAANTVMYHYDTRYQGWVRWMQAAFTGGTSLATVTDTDDFFLGGLDGHIYQVTGNGDTAAPGAITGATNANPISVTQTGHGYSTNDTVRISLVLGNTAANGQWIITKVDNNTYTLNSSVGNGAYTSGGFGAKVSKISTYYQSRGLGRSDQADSSYMFILRPTWFDFEVFTQEIVVASLNIWSDLSPPYSLSYTLSNSWGVIRERVPSDTRGNIITLGFGGSSYLPIEIRATGVECSIGRPRRI